MLCWGLVQARREYISQRNIKKAGIVLQYIRDLYHGHQRHKAPIVVQLVLD